jgi:hypothetical protein
MKIEVFLDVMLCHRMSVSQHSETVFLEWLWPQNQILTNTAVRTPKSHNVFVVHVHTPNYFKGYRNCNTHTFTL